MTRGREERALLFDALADTDWIVHDGAVAAAVESTHPIEVWLDHEIRPAGLEVRPYTDGEPVAEALLSNPLDTSLDQRANEFGEIVAETHGRIASTATIACSLVDPISDVHTMARMRVPTGVTETELEAAVRGLDDVACETTKLHETLRVALETWNTVGRNFE